MLQYEVHCRSLCNNWENYQVDIPICCTLLLIRAAKCQGEEVEIVPAQGLPPIRVLMYYLTLLNFSINEAEAVLSRLSELMNCAGMKFKIKKSRSVEKEECK